MSNRNLHLAKKTKNDEFYTRYEDIANELQHYDFSDKFVYCNCDGLESNFTKYFIDNFQKLNLRKLVCTALNTGEKFVYDADGGKFERMKEKGDFRSEECIKILQECDVVVTNPPFSIARTEFLPLLFKYDKQYLVVGDLNWIAYANVFPMIKESKMWMGYNYIKGFIEPNGEIKKFGNKCWFTNLPCDKTEIVLSEHYSADKYPKYDNYDAIEVGNVKDIPADYNGVMGVPITFLNKYSCEQFEILKVANGTKESPKAKINDKELFSRIFIKKRSLILTEHYTPDKYPKYDTYDAIEVSKVKDIPMDYDGVMAVPISYLSKHDPSRFEIVGELCHGSDNEYDYAPPILNGKEMYKRILIKKR